MNPMFTKRFCIAYFTQKQVLKLKQIAIKGARSQKIGLKSSYLDYDLGMCLGKERDVKWLTRTQISLHI